MKSLQVYVFKNRVEDKNKRRQVITKEMGNKISKLNFGKGWHYEDSTHTRINFENGVSVYMLDNKIVFRLSDGTLKYKEIKGVK